jgi:tripartite-type tricarboxylate transporter receptor subunit TctC
MTPAINRRAFVALGAAAALPATAQTHWPTKPVRIIVPYPAGGVGDLGTRTFAQRLSARIGQQVVIDTLPGGTQVVGMQALTRAPADGHTLILASPTSLVLNPVLRQQLPYAPEKLALVSNLFTSPLYIIASNKLPVNNVRELIAYAKANPDAVNYASTGEGSATHLATALFAQQAGVRMKHVPYKGSAQANADMVSGEVHLHFDPGAGTLTLVADSKLKALAVSGARRSKSLPNVPTVTESGLPYEVVSWWGLAAPEGTPRAITEQIAAATVQAAADPSLQEQAQKMSIEYAPGTPDEFTSFVAAERQRWVGMVRTLGLKPE